MGLQDCSFQTSSRAEGRLGWEPLRAKGRLGWELGEASYWVLFVFFFFFCIRTPVRIASCEAVLDDAAGSALSVDGGDTELLP